MFPYDDDTVNDDESVNDDQTRRTPRCFEVACLRGLDDARLLAALIRPGAGESSADTSRCRLSLRSRTLGSGSVARADARVDRVDRSQGGPGGPPR